MAIASALCAGKEILFYDEPTSGLDRGGMERFGALLWQMQDRVTSVIITHDPEDVDVFAGALVLYENGRARVAPDYAELRRDFPTAGACLRHVQGHPREAPSFV